jgi:hypothetical protein
MGIPSPENLHAVQRRKGMTSIRGGLDSVLNATRFVGDGVAKDELLDHLRAEFPGYAKSSLGTLFNVLKNEFYVIRSEGDQVVLTEQGESLLETGDVGDLLPGLITRILGVDNVLVALRDEGAKAMRLIGEAPLERLRRHHERQPLHQVRRIDAATAADLVRNPSLVAALRGELTPELVGGLRDTALRAPSVEMTLDNAANRVMAMQLHAIRTKLERLAERLRVPDEDTSVTGSRSARGDRGACKSYGRWQQHSRGWLGPHHSIEYPGSSFRGQD